MGQRFWKMSGSGNDFVFLDGREGLPEEWRSPRAIRALSARGTGVGADGVVYLDQPESGGSVRMRYFNADGSLASLCGNATLCTTRLAAVLGAADPAGMTIESDAGLIRARIVDGMPEIDLAPVTQVELDVIGVQAGVGERRMGFAVAGVPHLVVLDDNVDVVDVEVRGKALRWHPRLQPAGANVNFVGRRPDGRWAMRTFERGVEGETLACGTGAVACGLLLTAWGLATSPVTLETRSGQQLVVTIRSDGTAWHPSLRGEGRVVFTGELP